MGWLPGQIKDAMGIAVGLELNCSAMRKGVKWSPEVDIFAFYQVSWWYGWAGIVWTVKLMHGY
ncbi:uncharacterized protein N7479_006858 [Penicillium vulpinum]|uniref:uncharacterized protein n=1 Tax=Penicillium vulpinum TaxID=29845 RepID=UPI002548FBA7|nr:uncharacterized protein N7479_006858 [Penicillium vulpinum]KAJ5959708.1 hypothetical protein N7479_006858 [Penicillium vulpinum]